MVHKSSFYLFSFSDQAFNSNIDSFIRYWSDKENTMSIAYYSYLDGLFSSILVQKGLPASCDTPISLYEQNRDIR